MMIVRRLLISNHALLQQAAAFLDTVAPPELFNVAEWERGDWRGDVDGRPPLRDRPQPLSFRRQRLACSPRLDGIEMGDAQISALNYYPVGGGGLGWHTDTGHPGWRVYIARPLTAMPGVFLTVESAFIDAPGTALAFLVSGEPCASWHAVRSLGPRLSLGLRFKDGPTARALGLRR